LIAQSLVWWVFGSCGGILVMAVLPFGYYARNAWWGLFFNLATTFARLPILICGGGVMEVGLSVVASTAICNIPVFFSLVHVCDRERLLPIRPSSKLMIRNFSLSLVMALRNLLDFFRQQGTRIVLAPLAGTVAITGFSTMRTGANLALQGLQTLSSPLQPELMRFWGERDQQRVESCLSVVWAFVLFLMIPGGLVLQLVVRPLFELWTRDRVEFDPVLFSMLTVGVLFFGVAQPSMSIVQGANRLRSQLIIASISAAHHAVICIQEKQGWKSHHFTEHGQHCGKPRPFEDWTEVAMVWF